MSYISCIHISSVINIHIMFRSKCTMSLIMCSCYYSQDVNVCMRRNMCIIVD